MKQSLKKVLKPHYIIIVIILFILLLGIIKQQSSQPIVGISYDVSGDKRREFLEMRTKEALSETGLPSSCSRCCYN